MFRVFGLVVYVLLVGKKQCTKCKENKVFAMFSLRSPYGFKSHCKLCINQAYQNNRVANCQKTQAYYASHIAERREYARAYRKRPGKAAHNRLYMQDYAKRCKPIIVAARKRHRMRKHGAAVSDFTAKQWVVMQEAFCHSCAYCGKRAKGHLTQDHITPLSKDGNHTYANIVPACRLCNGRKHAGPVLNPVQPFLLLGA